MTQSNHKPQHEPLHLASPAPEAANDDADDVTPEQRQRDSSHDELFMAYAHWCRTRNFYAPAPVNGSVLGRLTKKGGSKPMEGGPDAPASATLSAIHLAVVAQPKEALDLKVFQLHYFYGVRSVKEAAHELGVSRPHWYRLLRAFRERVLAASQSIMDSNLGAARQLPSQGGVRQIHDDTD